MAEILVVGKGGFGDVLPLIAVARELQGRGHGVRMAAEAHHAQACAWAGVPFHALGASEDGAREPARGAWATARQALRDTLSPRSLAAEVRALLPLAADADVLMGSQLAYAGALARRLLHKPWVLCAASPLALPARDDAPTWPYLQGVQRAAARVGLPQRWFIGPARAATRALMRPQAAARREFGLRAAGHPRFEGLYSEQLNLLAASPLLAPQHTAWPAPTRVTGFAWFEPDFLGDDAQWQRLRDFAQAGSAPPLVFAPGGSLRTRPREFLAQAAAACRHLGRRGILVAAPRFQRELELDGELAVTGYMPYARLFALAGAVVHSAGIGTIGWGMRAGVAQLLLPTEWDQFDNARRAERAGVARSLPQTAGGARELARALGELLEDKALARRAADTAARVAAENGAAAACEAVEAMQALAAPR